MDQQFIGDEYLQRIISIKDPIAQVVTIHLFTEYWLDQIISGQLKNPHKFSESQVNYKTKLDLAYGMIELPSGLYSNLKKLNKLRNACAHNLDFNFEEADYNYDLTNLLQVDSNFGNLNNGPIYDRLNWIGILTFGWLNNFAISLKK